MTALDPSETLHRSLSELGLAMAAGFLRAVLVGAMAAASVPSLFLAISAVSDRWRSPDALPLYVQIGIVAAGALGLVTTATLVIGMPAALALRRFGTEGAASYITVGAVGGLGFVWAALSLVIGSSSPIEILVLAALSGAATGYTWWRSRPRGETGAQSAFGSRHGKASRPRSTHHDLKVHSWPPAPVPAGDISIRPLGFVMALGVMGMAIVVAAAGEGRFDRLPPQQYFPTAFRNLTTVVCARDGVANVEQLRGIEDFEAEWYSTHLRAAQEASLYLASQEVASRETRTYRFTWLRSFHAPVVVRIDELRGGAMRLTAKKLSGAGGYGPGRVEARVERLLTRDEVSRLNKTLSTGQVLDLPPRDCSPGVDGANWIVEASERGSYRYINRWSPERGPVRDLGVLLLGFTGWRLDPIY
ncbi:MAG: hypothetical protein EPO51_20370 [Phenylobacterium sp.]|uniref:hypothetical protein n=1 Tax=Phenylobacterium sp. TaxID=1871053 RepID=UPI001211F489|nr:hypothetical protein [Phenylobacterium sp.]TAJ69884.1 MAG: hypothetical protein EPO51_20370 [Phenylobacterium sp.]